MESLLSARKSTHELLKHIEWLVINHSNNKSSTPGLAQEVQEKAMLAKKYLDGVKQDSIIGSKLRETMQTILNLEALLKIGSGTEIKELEMQIDLTISKLQELRSEFSKDRIKPKRFDLFIAKFPSEIALIEKNLSDLLLHIKESPIDFQLLLLLGRYNEKSRIFDRNDKHLDVELRGVMDGLKLSNSVVGTFLELVKRSNDNNLRKYYYGMAVYGGALEYSRTKNPAVLPNNPQFREKVHAVLTEHNNVRNASGHLASELVSSIWRIKRSLSSVVNPVSMDIAHFYRRVKAASKRFRVLRDLDLVQQSSEFVGVIAAEAYNTAYAKYEKKLPGLRKTVNMLNRL